MLQEYNQNVPRYDKAVDSLWRKPLVRRLEVSLLRGMFVIDNSNKNFISFTQKYWIFIFITFERIKEDFSWLQESFPTAVLFILRNFLFLKVLPPRSQ